jgi:voltage-gated potassium channel
MTLNYDSKIKTWWNIFLAIVVFTITPHLSYRLVFHLNKPDIWYWFLIALYWIDIYIGFCVSVKSNLKIYSSHKEITRHYLRGWFIIDVIAGIPFEFFLILAPNEGMITPVVTVLRLLFLIKVVKVPLVLSQVQGNLCLNPIEMRLINFSFFFSHTVHYMALGWILIGASEASRPFFDQYLRSLYWVMTTVATIGYGDYYPDHDSNLQIFYTIIVQIFGVGMYGYVIGNMSAIIANLDSAKSAFMLKTQEINNFLRNKNVPKDLQKRVRDYYSYMWETRKNISSVSIIDELPRSCAIDILLFLNKDIVGKVSFFKNAGW